MSAVSEVVSSEPVTTSDQVAANQLECEALLGRQGVETTEPTEALTEIIRIQTRGLLIENHGDLPPHRPENIFREPGYEVMINGEMPLPLVRGEFVQDGLAFLMSKVEQEFANLSPEIAGIKAELFFALFYLLHPLKDFNKRVYTAFVRYLVKRATEGKAKASNQQLESRLLDRMGDIRAQLFGIYCPELELSQRRLFARKMGLSIFTHTVNPVREAEERIASSHAICPSLEGTGIQSSARNEWQLRNPEGFSKRDIGYALLTSYIRLDSATVYSQLQQMVGLEEREEYLKKLYQAAEQLFTPTN